MDFKFSFQKCYFCRKNFNKLQLIEMNQNSVQINNEEVDYASLVLDTCLKKVLFTK